VKNNPMNHELPMSLLRIKESRGLISDRTNNADGSAPGQQALAHEISSELMILQKLPMQE
jgi:hypothetical protein